VTALSRILAVSPGTRLRMLVVNGALLCLYAALLNARKFRETLAAQCFRDWLPLALMLLAYKEMGWLAPVSHDHHLENSWILWARFLLRTWHLREVIEAAGPLFPSLLEICYLFVYAMPAFAVAMLYIHRKRASADHLLVIYLCGLFLSYVQFPFWPS